MKRLSKILSVLLSAIMLTAAFSGCSQGAMDYPDYSTSTQNFNLYAFYGPSKGTRQGGVPMGDGTDMRTKERYQEYKDAGFNILLIENEAPYSGEEWSTSDCKRVMDICFEIGLDVIVHDTRFYRLATNETPIIGQTINGIKIKTQEDFNQVAAEYMKDYMKHPAFYGIYVIDEPFDEKMANCAMITTAIKSVNPDVYVHTCLMTGQAQDYIDGEKGKFIDSGWVDLVYDSYHALFTREEKSKPGYYDPDEDIDRQNPSYISTLDKFARLSKKYDMNFTAVTLQSYGGDYNGADQSGWRNTDEIDMRYAAYVTMAYAPNNMVWYHYWSCPYGEQKPIDSAWIDQYGNKLWYDVGKQINTEMLDIGSTLSHFDFVAGNYYADKDRMPYYYTFANGSKRSEFQKQGYSVAYTTPISGASVVNNSLTGEMLLTQLYDEDKDVTGYFITNTKDPKAREGMTATVKFDNCKFAVVYKKGVPEIVKLKRGTLRVSLDCADGIFVLPY